MSWSVRRINKFKTLCTEEPQLSFAVIAERMGGFRYTKDGGRNACIGMSRRLGLTPRKREPAEDRVVEERAPRARKAPKPPVETRARLTDGRLPPTAPVAVPEFTTARYCTIFDLTDKSCRYPCWQDGAPLSEQFFCGMPTASVLESRPYCSFHHSLAFTAPSQRKDAAYHHGRKAGARAA